MSLPPKLAEARRQMASVDAPSAITDEILLERMRQMQQEGWTLDHDDQHRSGEMALAAALYALPYQSLKQGDFAGLQMTLELTYDWHVKPDPDPRRRLVKAAALIVAEIERLDRATKAERAA